VSDEDKAAQDAEMNELLRTNGSLARRRLAIQARDEQGRYASGEVEPPAPVGSADGGAGRADMDLSPAEPSMNELMRDAVNRRRFGGYDRDNTLIQLPTASRDDAA
jgi:hypothetical protein